MTKKEKELLDEDFLRNYPPLKVKTGKDVPEIKINPPTK